MGSAPKVPKPQDPLALAGGQSSQLLSYYGSEVPKFMELQSQLGPGLMAQMLGQSSQFLKGADGQPGFNKLQKSAGKVAGQTIAELRARELGQMTGQAGLTRGLMDAISPEQAAAVRASAQEAERARASAQGVTPQEQRMYEQTAREGAQAAGRLGGNAGLAAEIMGREGVLGSKREEAARAGARSYEMAGGFYTQPGLQALSSAPLSYGAGQQNLATAMSMGPASSGQFDYNAPLGFAGQRASALDRQAMAQYQADQQRRAQMMGLATAGLGLAAAPFTGGLSAGLGLGSGGFGGMMSGLGTSAGMGLRQGMPSIFGAIPKATIV
jgi:hypothetical protein